MKSGYVALPEHQCVQRRKLFELWFSRVLLGLITSLAVRSTLVCTSSPLSESWGWVIQICPAPFLKLYKGPPCVVPFICLKFLCYMTGIVVETYFSWPIVGPWKTPWSRSSFQIFKNWIWKSWNRGKTKILEKCISESTNIFSHSSACHHFHSLEVPRPTSLINFVLCLKSSFKWIHLFKWIVYVRCIKLVVILKQLTDNPHLKYTDFIKFPC